MVEVPSLAGTPWMALLPNAVKGMLALLLGNAFIVGINQVRVHFHLRHRLLRSIACHQ